MFRSLVLVALSAAALSPAATVFSENFDNVAGLAGAGWSLQNNSVPLGSTGWFQGNTGVFSAQAGAADSYVAANFNNAGAGGDVDNWLITPVISLVNGTTISFYVQAGAELPDALDISLNPLGTTNVAQFTTPLLSIDPVLGGGWNLYSATITTLAVPTNSRIAFRYRVTNTDINGDYIGIDTLLVDADTGIPEPATFALAGMALAAFGLYRRYGNHS